MKREEAMRLLGHLIWDKESDIIEIKIHDSLSTVPETREITFVVFKE